MRSNNNSFAILATLCYSDMFAYPLTEEEIWKYLINPFTRHPELGSGSIKEIPNQVRNDKNFLQGIKKLQKEKKILYKSGYYCLQNREQIIPSRLRREEASKKKQQLAEKIAHILFTVPTVKFIGISGSLAMNNAEEDEDIDFFIITKGKTVWITRLLLLIFLQILGKRRKITDTSAPNKICLNMIIDEFSLEIPKPNHNIYTAHEVVQVKPLLSRDNIYKKFITANMWVKDILPNSALFESHNKSVPMRGRIISCVLGLLEYIAYSLQIIYMRRHKTTEIATPTALAVYPANRAKSIVQEFEKRKHKILQEN